MAWACLFFHHMANSNYDKYYRELLNDNVISILRTNPKKLTNGQVKERIIKGFLLKWGCRPLQASDDLAQKIIQSTFKIRGFLKQLNGKKLINLDLDKKEHSIKKSYETVISIGNGFSHTATSKFLHVLNPELFVIWDGPMRKHYKKHAGIPASPDGYFEYMKKMQEALLKVSKSFPAKNGSCPAKFISRKLGIKNPKTLVKFLDEYNWISITRKVNLPLTWHP